MFGFLFGIPRVLQKGGKDGSNGANGTRTTASNTNLEQVSDWLTAIIIGASLVQLQEIGRSLDWLAKEVSKGVAIPGQGYAVAYFSIVYFFVVGLLFSYLFTRINLAKAFSRVEDELSKVQNAADNSEKEKDLLLDQVKRLVGRDVPELERPKVAGDQNKGKFGGAPSRNGRTLAATVTPLDEKGTYCTVELKVTGSLGSPLTGKVVFYLHESFKPNDKVEVAVVENVASLRVIAYGGFTVGAVADQGQTELELDLETDPSVVAPPAWRAS